MLQLTSPGGEVVNILTSLGEVKVVVKLLPPTISVTLGGTPSKG